MLTVELVNRTKGIKVCQWINTRRLCAESCTDPETGQRRSSQWVLQVNPNTPHSASLMCLCDLQQIQQGVPLKPSDPSPCKAVPGHASPLLLPFVFPAWNVSFHWFYICVKLRILSHLCRKSSPFPCEWRHDEKEKPPRWDRDCFNMWSATFLFAFFFNRGCLKPLGMLWQAYFLPWLQAVSNWKQIPLDPFRKCMFIIMSPALSLLSVSQTAVTKIPLGQVIVDYIDQAEFSDNGSPRSLFLMKPSICICVQAEATQGNRQALCSSASLLSCSPSLVI